LDTLIPTWLIWFILGFVFAFLELFLPSFILIFFAIGCWGSTLILLLWDLSLTQQILMFIVTSIISLLLLRKWLIQTFRGISDVVQDQDFDDFPRGEHVQVSKIITPDKMGRVQYRGTDWDAVAEEMIEPGEIVEIIRYAGNSRQTYFVRKVT